MTIWILMRLCLNCGLAVKQGENNENILRIYSVFNSWLSFGLYVCRSTFRGLMMRAYFIKCKHNLMGTESISTTLYYFESQAQDIANELNSKNDGYTYFIHASNI
jgi:hypothetical protein